ncbi:DUF4374 domain-containing protein [Belliella sp. DSM 111904]|uniref:DUF4374 domain-containing protein n=1 Tax=Belliella filtrata TaxID=2923435 RepID=A0ABS9UXU0_9BACT|nr:DUF4374 domain-containing protein [Belliella filtrata]MCH7408991.1 DUF4374 domain-containing protein [Belliella filtrata]
MNNKTKFVALAICAMFSVFFACENNELPGPDNPASEQDYRYVVTSTPISSDGVADYLLTVDDLDKGTVSTLGNGIEQDGTYRYYVSHKNKFFSLLYGQGNPGAVTTYTLDATGKLQKLSDFQAETVQAFAIVKDDLLMVRIPRNINTPTASWYRMDTELLQIVDEGQIDLKALKSDEEMGFFTWVTQVGDKVYAPYMSIKGCCSDSFGTNDPDKAWIAIYAYPSMELEKIITDDRISSIGRYFNEGLAVVENGDVYAFSPANTSNNSEMNSSKPSAIVRVKAGQDEFDQDFFMDIESLTNGHYLHSWIYIGNGKFVLMLGNPKEVWGAAKFFAIADVNTKNVSWVSGIPNAEDIISVTSNNYSPLDGKSAYIGITTTEGSYVYHFDAESNTAAKGLEVEGGTITAIRKLEKNN